MLFLQFVQYSLSFAGTPKNEIPGAALELCQLKIKQFSPEILKFSTKHEDNPFNLNCYMVPCTFFVYISEGTLGKTLSRRSEIAAKCRVEFFYFRVFIQSVIIFSVSNSRKNVIFHIFYLIKKLCKMPKFAKFVLVISLFKYSRNNFLDLFLNLSRGMTCLENIFVNVDFLIYFELF